MKINGANIIVKLLEKFKIEVITGIPGGANLPLYEALHNSKIKHILARHEQGAGFISHGMARSTGEIGVCLATSGPGVTNVLTAIADAKLDSVPLIVITGQVTFNNIGTDAFQEVDTYSLTIPISKHNFLVRSASELVETMYKAFDIALDKRFGPVVIDVPKNVFIEEIELDIDSLPTLFNKTPKTNFDDKDIIKMAEMINESKKPVLYFGGGIRCLQDNGILIEIARKNSIPITSTLMGLGSFPTDDNLYLGMLGMHGARYTNFAINEADLLISLGARFDDRATGNVKKFCANAKIIHVDIDQAEINKIKLVDHYINGDLNDILLKLIDYIEKNDRKKWVERVALLKKEYPLVLPPVDQIFSPVNMIKDIAKYAGRDVFITTDVGQHQMWVAQVYPFSFPKQFLTSGGLGTMGFGLPSAIGVGIKYPDKKVICFSGDGSFLMNIQELATLAEYDINVKVVIFNNKCLGMVRQQQELFYNSYFTASKYEKDVDFVKIAEGFGIKGVRLSEKENNYYLLEEYIKSDESCVIDIEIMQDANLYPIVKPGFSNTEMIGGEKYE